jgi:hypothetical protein
MRFEIVSEITDVATIAEDPGVKDRLGFAGCTVVGAGGR